MLPFNTYLLYELPLNTAFRPNKKTHILSKVKFENETFGKGKSVHKSIIQILTTQLSAMMGVQIRSCFCQAIHCSTAAQHKVAKAGLKSTKADCRAAPPAASTPHSGCLLQTVVSSVEAKVSTVEQPPLL